MLLLSSVAILRKKPISSKLYENAIIIDLMNPHMHEMKNTIRRTISSSPIVTGGKNRKEG